MADLVLQLHGLAHDEARHRFRVEPQGSWKPVPPAKQPLVSACIVTTEKATQTDYEEQATNISTGDFSDNVKDPAPPLQHAEKGYRSASC